MTLIIVAGVPGTGKTVIGSWLARRLGCTFTTLSWLVLENGLWSSYDVRRRSFIIDYDRLVEHLRNSVSSVDCTVVETHWVEPFIEAGLKVDYILLTRCHPLKLYERLLRRDWPLRKIVENVEAELVGVIVSEVSTLDVPVGEVDTSGVSVEEARRVAYELVNGRVQRCCIDWVSMLSPREVEELTRLLEAPGAGYEP